MHSLPSLLWCKQLEDLIQVSNFLWVMITLLELCLEDGLMLPFSCFQKILRTINPQRQTQPVPTEVCLTLHGAWGFLRKCYVFKPPHSKWHSKKYCLTLFFPSFWLEASRSPVSFHVIRVKENNFVLTHDPSLEVIEDLWGLWSKDNAFCMLMRLMVGALGNLRKGLVIRWRRHG